MSSAAPRILGRYALYAEIASGGMAAVHLGRLLGPVGFSRTVAIKRLHPQFAKDPEFVAMFLDEARLAARIRHPNVVPTLDVVALEGELFLVLDYVHGESLSALLRESKKKGAEVPLSIISAVLAAALYGLHAAHEAKNERGEPLHIVHRDVSPQNILVGTDGVARVLDFGVAKAAGRLRTTREGQLKGKLPYMAPEQFNGIATRSTDVYAAGVVLWEALTGHRLFEGSEAQVLAAVLQGEVEPPSRYARGVPAEIDEIVLRAVDKDPARRFPTAREMARAIERTVPPAPASDVGEWVEGVAHNLLTKRVELLSRVENERASPALLPAGAYELSSSDVTTPVNAGSGEASEPATNAQLSSSVVRSAPERSARDHRRVGVVALATTFAAVLLVVFAVRLVAGSARSDGAKGSSPSAAPAVDDKPTDPPSRSVDDKPTDPPSRSVDDKPTAVAAPLLTAEPPAPSSPREAAPTTGAAPSSTPVAAAPSARVIAPPRRNTIPKPKPTSAGPIRFRTPD